MVAGGIVYGLYLWVGGVGGRREVVEVVVYRDSSRGWWVGSGCKLVGDRREFHCPVLGCFSLLVFAASGEAGEVSILEPFDSMSTL